MTSSTVVLPTKVLEALKQRVAGGERGRDWVFVQSWAGRG